MIKVVVVAPGPFDHGPYCSSCSPAAGWTALERFQLGDNFIAETAQRWSNGSCHLPRMACHLASGHDRCVQCGTRPIHTGLCTCRHCLTRCILSPVKPFAALTRHVAPLLRPRCAPAITNYHSTFGDVGGRPGTHPLHRFGQPGADCSKASVRLCGTQPRARRANRGAQSTAHH